MNSSISVVGKLNKRAVVLVRSGNYDGAAVALCRAVDLIQSTSYEDDYYRSSWQRTPMASSAAREREERVSTTNSRMEIDEDAENDEEICLLRPIPIDNPINHFSSGIDEENLFEFYSSMLVLQQGHCANTEHVITLYNSAVASHHEAFRHRGQTRRHRLQRALDLYNAAQVVLYDSWSVIADDDILLLLSLALCNNVGHVHYWLLNFKDCRNSLEALQHFMGSLPVDYSEDDEESPGSLSRKDYEFFNKTIVIFEGASFLSAPSA
jgi:hypothetical protein